MKIKDFTISKYSDDILREILWQLRYMPEEELNRLGEDKISAEELIEYIRNECDKSSRQLLFGGEIPVADTRGVDLGIIDGIVRDSIIKRCNAAVFDEVHCIEKAIKCLKYDDDGSEFNTKKIFGGLREIGFCKKEADYIMKTCNCHPIALLLERYNQELEEMPNSEESSEGIEIPLMQPTESKPGKLIAVSQQVKNDSDNIPLSVESLLKNKEIISKLLSPESEAFDFKDLNDISSEILAVKERLEQLCDLENDLKKLDADGISLGYIASRKDEIKNFFNSMAALM